MRTADHAVARFELALGEAGLPASSWPRRQTRHAVLYGIGDPALPRAGARGDRRAQGHAVRPAGGAASSRAGRRGPATPSSPAGRSAATRLRTARRSTEGAPTVAVLGCGADLVYPSNASELLAGDRRMRGDRLRAPLGHPAAALDVSNPQPHHRGPLGRAARARGRPAERHVQHRRLRARRGPRRLRGAGLDLRARVPRREPAAAPGSHAGQRRHRTRRGARLGAAAACDGAARPLAARRRRRPTTTACSPRCRTHHWRPDDLARELELDIVTVARRIGALETSGLVVRFDDGRYGGDCRPRRRSSALHYRRPPATKERRAPQPRTPSAIEHVTVIGAGLAGTEAAWQLAARGIPVTLVEMRPGHAEPGAPHRRLRRTRLLELAQERGPRHGCGTAQARARALWAASSCALRASVRVPAGSALAVDRERFSAALTRARRRTPAGRPSFAREAARHSRRARHHRDGSAHQPGARAGALQSLVGDARLAFYDAAAPIVDAETIDRSIVFAASRYDKGEGADYLNAPMDRDGVRGVSRRARLGAARHGQGVRARRPVPGVPAGRRGRAHGARRAAVRRAQAGRPHRPAHRRAPVGGRAAARRERRPAPRTTSSASRPTSRSASRSASSA